MAPEKISKLLKYEYIIYSFEARDVKLQICNYSCEISKSRDFMNTLKNFATSVFAHTSISYSAEVCIYL